MAGFDDRYATAINARSLKSDPRSRMSDPDVLAAIALACKFDGVSLGAALKRLFAGDGHAAGEIVEILAEMAWYRSRKVSVRLNRFEAQDMAKKCLAWHRNSVCTPCGGHGLVRNPDSPTFSDHKCPSCNGRGRVDFDGQFPDHQRELARWLDVEMVRESGRAGIAAMSRLAREMDL